ncbi:protein OS-9 isoform X2 [Erpetoichthys calabaricus]|uniref:protein OS-9 isoform X2 n=1 Tax=Erpetoichthys calabaricus TaxID=27687 RepID=UPI00223406F2|nr:protein OS-9 isoform X2 [Erpetoichthys calabaricus]
MASAMSRGAELWSFWTFISFFFLSAVALLNLEELNEMKYGIEILPDPVIRGQALSEDVLVVSSKYKQLYECKLPAQAKKFQQDSSTEEDSDGYTGLEISELLKPMDGAPCLFKTKDWWTYEFCYGQFIRQYHMQDSEIKGDIIYLGYYGSEFDWNNETAKASKQHRLKRYHSQTYVNGSKCDLNGKPRETEVRFLCEEGSGDYIARVDEPQSCSYVLTIHTTRTCHHPFLRPPSSIKPQHITCQPALSPEHYVEYVKAHVSDTKRKVERISKELENLDEILSKDVNGKEEQQQEEEEEVVVDEDMEEALRTMEDGEAPHIMGTDQPEDSSSEFWDQINRADSLELDGSEQEEEPSVSEAEAIEEEEDFVDQGFENHRFKFKIIKNPTDLMKLIQQLKKTANKLTVENSEGDASSPPEDGKREDITEETSENDVNGKDGSEDSLNGVQHEGDLKEDVRRALDSSQKEEAEGLKGEFDRKQASKTLNTPADKVEGTGDEQHEEDAVDVSRASASQAPRQPGKIEVKILSRGGADDDDVHWLTEEDTKSFRELLINLLTSGTEEVYKEQQRQQELENNYQFVWGEKAQEEATTGAPSSTDPDDVDF